MHGNLKKKKIRTKYFSQTSTTNMFLQKKQKKKKTFNNKSYKPQNLTIHEHILKIAVHEHILT